MFRGRVDPRARLRRGTVLDQPRIHEVANEKEVVAPCRACEPVSRSQAAMRLAARHEPASPPTAARVLLRRGATDLDGRGVTSRALREQLAQLPEIRRLADEPLVRTDQDGRHTTLTEIHQ